MSLGGFVRSGGIYGGCFCACSRFKCSAAHFLPRFSVLPVSARKSLRYMWGAVVPIPYAKPLRPLFYIQRYNSKRYLPLFQIPCRKFYNSLSAFSSILSVSPVCVSICPNSSMLMLMASPNCGACIEMPFTVVVLSLFQLAAYCKS